MNPLRRQRGYLLITVVTTLFLLATISALLAYDSANNAKNANSEMEAARVEYVARAGLQTALWRAQNNACMGDITIPSTVLGNDSFDATISGAADGNLVVLDADQDAWIRNDDPTKNNGTPDSNHVRYEAGNIEQVLTRFDVSSITSKAQINSAIAWFHLKSGKIHPEGHISIHEITADWDEKTVTWDSFSGAYRTAPLAAIQSQEVDDVWVAVNVTGLVQAWVNGLPNYGILFNSTAEGLHTEYTSREEGVYPPRLEVVIGGGSASPVTIKAKGRLDTGAARNLKDRVAVAYQQPATTVMKLGAEGKDGWVSSTQTSNNYGVAGEMTISGGANPKHFLIQFPFERIPHGSRVVSARMEIFLNWLGSADTAAAFSVHRMTEPWSEGSGNNWNPGDGANWNTSNGSQVWDWQTNHDSGVAVNTTSVDPNFNGWHTWDITELAQQWVEGTQPNYGMVIKGNDSALDAWFRSSDYADPAHHPQLIVEYACECGSPCTELSGSGKILLVVRDQTNMWYYDTQKKEILESWGYTVNVIDDDANAAAYSANIPLNDIAYISEPIRESSLSTKLSDASIGIVSDEGRMNDELGIADLYATPVLGREINISDNTHYITSVFPTGDLEIYSKTMEALTLSGNVSTEAQELADWKGTASLVALGTGKKTVSGGVAPARRVVLPFGRQVDSNLNWDNLSGNGRLIVNRAIDWAMGSDKGLPSYSLLMVVVDPASLTAQETAKQSLIESWDYEVSLIGESDSADEFNKFALNVDVIFVSEDVLASNVGSKLNSVATGVVIEEANLADDLGFADGIQWDFGNKLSVDNNYYITSPFSFGSLAMLTTSESLAYLTGNVSPDAKHLGNSDSGPALVTLAAGAQLVGGGVSAGRRVMLPWGGDSMDFSHLNDDGLTLFRRALEWAAGNEPGFVAHWKLDDASGLVAVDSVGGHDGTLLNGPAWTDGAIDGGVQFSGSTQAISVAHADSLTISDDLTLAGWFYLDEMNPNRPIVMKGTSNIDINYYLGISQDQIQFAMSPPGGGWYSLIVGALPIATGAWYHAAVSFDNDNKLVRFYLDGVEVGTKTSTHGPSEFAGSVRIGRNDTGYGFGGRLDDVRIYRRVLAAGEIAEIAERPPILPVAHWKLDETSGTTAEDSAGTHDGTTANTTWVPGKVDGGLLFNSASDSVTAPHAEELSITDTLTVSAWINKTGRFGYDGAVVKATTGSDVNYFLGTWESNPVFGFSTSTDNWQGYYATGTNLSEGTWYHLLATFDNAADLVQIYVDGTLAQSFPTTLEPVTNTGNIFLGRSAIGEYWPGTLDDVRIYDQVLDASDIAALAGAGGGAGPIAHWTMDDGSGVTATDVVGGHDGTLTNGPVWTTGQLGSAVRFDGSNDRINVPHDTGLDLGSAMTLSAWVYIDTLKPFQMVLTKGDNGVNENYWLATEGNKANFGFIDGGLYAQHTTSGLTLQTARWHHIAATFDDAANEVKIYVDGVAETFTNNNTPDTNSERLIIGNSYYGEGFDGVIDDVRIYNRVLNAAEISSIGAGGGGNPGGGGGGSDCNGTFRDNFDAQSFSGSNGTLTWAGDWIEVGESDGPTSGDIQVRTDQSNYQLRTRDNDSGGEGVERAVDLSGASTATLRYDYRRVGLDRTSDYTKVEISANGAAWSELTRHQGGSNDGSYQQASHDISGHISSNTRIRFITSSSMGGTDTVWFDNVEIQCTP